MPSFFINDLRTSTHTLLTGEIGVIGPNGLLAPPSGVPLTSAASANDLALSVSGTLISNDTYAIDASGNLNLTVSTTGLVEAKKSDAALITADGDWTATIRNHGTLAADTILETRAFQLSRPNVDVTNSGSIHATGVAFDLRLGDDTTIGISNAGSIIATEAFLKSVSSAELLTPVIRLDNTGEIIVRTGQLVSLAGDSALHLNNTGTILAPIVEAIITQGGADRVWNSGTIHGGITFGAGNDAYRGASGTLVGQIIGGGGTDSLYGGQGPDNFSGGNETDVLLGRGGNDTLSGGNDNDTLRGGEGQDHLIGDNGADSLFGGEGQDTIDGGLNDDEIWGGRGDDSIDSGAGSNSVWGGAGDDTLIGGADFDDLKGGAGDDSIRAGDLRDTLTGGRGDDALFGDLGWDSLLGGAGDDTLSGGAGGDTLRGGGGDDTLDGGADKDLLQGGKGDDTLTGGADKDTFVFIPGSGRDHITDFTDTEDRIDLKAWHLANFSDLTSTHALEQVDGAVRLTFATGDVLILEGALMSNTTGADFFF